MSSRGSKPQRNPNRKTTIEPNTSRLNINTDKLTPIFCLAHIVSGYCISNLDTEKRAAFALTLQQRCKMTWGEIKAANRLKAGTELMPVNQIKPSIPERFQDTDKFLVFRYHGLHPMLGVRINEVFHVLWIENIFGDVYDH
jgi:hypothetical protein